MKLLSSILIGIFIGFLTLEPLFSQSIPQDKRPPKIESLRSDLDALSADSTIDEKDKLALINHYKAAIQFLQNAEQSKAQTETYNAEVDDSPDKTKDWLAKLELLESKKKTDTPIALPEDTSNLQKIIDTKSDELEALTERRSFLANEISQSNTRPIEISTRTREIQMRLSQLKEFFDQPTASNSAKQTAQNRELLSEEYALEAEDQMLKAEQKSIDVNLARFEAELNYRNQDWEIKSEELKNLKIEQSKLNQSEAQKTLSNIRKFNFPNNPDLAEATTNLEELIKEYEASVNQRNQIDDFYNAIVQKLKKITA